MNAPAAIRVVVATPAALLRECLAAGLATRDFAVVACGATFDALAQTCAQAHADVLILDHRLVDCRLARLAAFTAARGIVLLVPPSAPEISRYSRDIARCHLVTAADDLDALSVAVRRAATGSAPADPPADRVSVLSDREVEVLQLLATGLSSRAIGDRLVVSARTIESHRRRMMTKLGVGSTAALIRVSVARGLLR